MPQNSEKQEVHGPYPELARLVRRILGTMSARVASRKTGISHTTIANMLHGDKVSYGMLARFAEGFQTDLGPLLAAAGYVEPEDLGGAFTRAWEQWKSVADVEPDPESIVIHAEGFRDLDEVNRMALHLTLESAAKAFIDAQKAARAVESIGGGASPAEKRAAQRTQDEFTAKLRERLDRERGA